MLLIRRQILQLAAVAGAGAVMPSRAPAQAYPTRPVRVIVTTGPGGQGDITARLVTAKLTELLGQSFYVENIGGGGGNIAMGIAARAAPRRTAIQSSAPPATLPSMSACIRKSPTSRSGISRRFRCCARRRMSL